ncbi:MAG: GNAT family N-acetyltransferase [Desulfosudis oleivorans]|nr:GNAT family N-acetyltransferase [Desulfosudis oleivorans]
MDKWSGFVAGDPRPRDGWGWIATIAVDPRYRRRGIGRALLHACEDKAQRRPLAPYRADLEPGCHLHVRKGRLLHH